MSDFMRNEVLKDGVAKPGEMITIPKRVYQMRIGRAYHHGQIDALLRIGKSIPEIAKILKLQESTIRKLTGVETDE